MAGFANSSIKRKLIIIQSVTAFLAVLICCVIFLLNNIKIFKGSAVTKLQSIARIVGDNAASPLVFVDAEAGHTILRNLENEPDIMDAVILDKTGKIFCRYTRPGKEVLPVPTNTEQEQVYYEFSGAKLLMKYKIYQAREFLGTLVLRSELTELDNMIANFIKTALLVLLGGLLSAIAISFLLQRSISSRLLALVSKTKEISETGNYSIRVPSGGKDEIGILSGEYNAMLEQIEKMAKSLREANIELEEKVKSRTSELSNANDTLRIEVTERKKAQEELIRTREFIESGQKIAHLGSWEWNVRSNLITWSDELFRIYGLEHWMGVSTLEDTKEYIIPEDRNIYSETIKKALTDLQPYELYFRIKRKDSKIRTLYTKGNVETDDANVPLRIWGATQDVTETKEAEQEISKLNQNLKEKLSELEVANKELESFSYTVSHDLRAPLRAINGFTQIIMQKYNDKLDDEGKRFLGIVTDNAKKMGQLIDDLLAFSRLGKKEIQKSKLDTNELVNSILLEIDKSQWNANAKITVKELMPVLGDRALLHQVFYNLITNSLKYSAKTPEPVIEIGSWTEGNESIFYVKDNGVGFDMKFYDKLFKVFQRLHSPEEFEGSGVGLAIVNRIVTKHGGKVWAEGKVNEGATFYFSLPKIEMTSLPAEKTDNNKVLNVK
jgi:PAS domain S-box-containing protein